MFVFRKRRLVIYMKVRIEVVKCANCKMNNHFLYLSDFSYGERLVLFDNGTKYAYIDLLQDSVYSDFIDKVKEILGSYKAEVSGNVFQNMIDNMFSMTCDKIDGSDVDFVMNYEELGALFVAKKIQIMELEETQFNKESSKQGRNFGCVGGGNGYTFASYNHNDLLFQINRAIKDYGDKEGWREKVRTVMSVDFSWDKSVKKYIDLYKSLVD